MVVRSGCNLDTNKYYFRPNAYYIIRHFGGYCWVYDSSSNFIKLRNPNVCDRFHYENDYHLRHVNTGKCVIYDDPFPYYLRLTDDCTSPKTVFKQNAYSNIELEPGYCVHPLTGLLQPPFNDHVVRYFPGCADDDRLRFYFHDERGSVYHSPCKKLLLKAGMISVNKYSMRARSTALPFILENPLDAVYMEFHCARHEKISLRCPLEALIAFTCASRN